MNKEKVEVVPYNTEWAKMFELEAILIKEALGQNCLQTYHIGSTAVPGLSAKPVIDIIAVVKDIMKVDEANKAMENLGYKSKGENGMLFRRFFQKRGRGNNYNIHIFEEGNSEIDRHFKFRDWMINHADDRALYEKLKKDLAAKYPNDIFNYCFGKERFVADIDKKTGFNGLRVVKALTPRELKAVEHFREKSSTGKMLKDAAEVANHSSKILEATEAFDRSENIYFALYQGSDIIGYANIQLIPDTVKLAITWDIFIDEPYRSQDIDNQLSAIFKRWIEEQGIVQSLKFSFNSL
ncbi:MAG: GNAT family N-acetyltransferase [Verrucomicrobia bacterium]|nr:MAG: GNAT family N-acetyltransferase [Verrucomicrobiota bacterium]